jgi:hypothetical protein
MELAHTVSKHCQIYHLISLLYPDEANMPGYGQLHIFDSAETTKRTEDQSNQRGMAEVTQRLDEMLRAVSPFVVI